jgi:phospholipase C
MDGHEMFHRLPPLLAQTQKPGRQEEKGERAMSKGLDGLKHIVVLMMENRSFDHMLGALRLVMENGQKKYPRINGLTGNESNPDTKGVIVKVQPNAQFQSQLDPDPDHHFPGIDLQIFGGRFTQTNDVTS